jgi:hypothetical protein
MHPTKLLVSILAVPSVSASLASAARNPRARPFGTRASRRHPGQLRLRDCEEDHILFIGKMHYTFEFNRPTGLGRIQWALLCQITRVEG